MIQVKWVHESKLFHNPLSARQIPVIPLAALTEVVEGLKRTIECIEVQNMLQCQYEGDLTVEEAIAAGFWPDMAVAARAIAQRLLAQLEVPRG
jgi:hypothetical protein